jgi:hypothetical protein
VATGAMGVLLQINVGVAVGSGATHGGGNIVLTGVLAMMSAASAAMMVCIVWLLDSG